MNRTKKFRILAISLSTRGFGYAVSEGEDALVDYGNKVIRKNKNPGSLAHIEKAIARNQPEILVLHDVDAKGTHRRPRIKRLHRKVIALAKKRKLKVVTISGTEVRSRLLGNAKGTKHEIAELLAKRFPDELAPRLPPKRRTGMNEDTRMDIFDAVALIETLRVTGK